MKKEITVRRIRPEELDSLIALYAHLHHKDATLPGRPAVDAIWANIVTSPFFHCIVGELENGIVSSCTLATIPNLTRGARPYGIIENVVTHTDLRKHGFGTEVLHYALRLAWEKDCYKVMLLTGSKEESMFRFYEGTGFKRGIKTGFIAYPPKESD